jgi:hypothetical protein
MMRRTAGFHADKARRQRCEERQEIAPTQRLGHNNLANCINRVDLEKHAWPDRR